MKTLAATGTASDLKVRAIEVAIDRAGLREHLRVEGYTSHSGVPEQPLGINEIKFGSATRAHAVESKGDFTLGIENGLIEVYENYVDIAIITLFDFTKAKPKSFTTTSVGIPCPLEFVEASLATGRTKTAGHFYALAHPGVAADDWHLHATGGRLSRETILADAIYAALALAFPVTP